MFCCVAVGKLCLLQKLRALTAAPRYCLELMNGRNATAEQKHTTAGIIHAIVVINVTEELKKVKTPIFIKRKRKKVCTREQETLPLFYLFWRIDIN